MMIVIDRRRARWFTDAELRKACRDLSKAWERAGRPAEDDMPAVMLCNYLCLKEERERRGEQLRLF
jgi:hypothetical protein